MKLIPAGRVHHAVQVEDLRRLITSGIVKVPAWAGKP
jgi:hypothetical protein